MKKGRSQGFVHGAAVLAAAGIAVKIIGALYKIPLGVILGPVGMADFSIAYNIYALLFVISTAGVPAAVSKMVSEATAGARSGEPYRIYKASYLSFVIVGALGFAVMFFGAAPLAQLMGSRGAAASIRAISPAVLFVSMSAINRGYFQGRSNMYPTAISEIIEALGKLAIGISAAWWLRLRGFSEGVISAGAVLGVTAGAFFSALFFAFCRDDIEKKDIAPVRSSKSIIKELVSLAVPITLGAAVISLSNVIDSALVMNLLQKNGFDETRAKWLFGAYNYAATLFNLPSALVTTLAVSLIPAASSALARRDYIRVDSTANSALAIAELIAVPAACGMAALSYGIVGLLYGAGVDSACIEVSGRLLFSLSFAVPLLAVVTVTNALHQSLGNANIPVLSMLAGAAVKIISNIFLVGHAGINIYGAAQSTILCYGTVALLNIRAMKRYPYIELSITEIFLRPALVGAAVYVSARLAFSAAKSTFGGNISTVLAVFSGIIVCIACAFLVGMFGKDEKTLVFGNKNISKFLNND